MVCCCGVCWTRMLSMDVDGVVGGGGLLLVTGVVGGGLLLVTEVVVAAVVADVVVDDTGSLAYLTLELHSREPALVLAEFYIIKLGET